MINQENFDILYKKVMHEGFRFMSPGVSFREPPSKEFQDQHTMLQVQKYEDRDSYLREIFKYVVMKKGR